MKITKSQLQELIREEIENSIPKKDWTKDILQTRSLSFHISNYGPRFQFVGRGPGGAGSEYVFYDGNKLLRLHNITSIEKHPKYGYTIYVDCEKERR